MGSGSSAHAELNSEQATKVLRGQAALKTCLDELEKQDINRQKLEAKLKALEQQLFHPTDQKDEVSALLADLASQSSANVKAKERVQTALADLEVLSKHPVRRDEEEKATEQPVLESSGAARNLLAEALSDDNAELRLEVVRELGSLLQALVNQQGMALGSEDERLKIGQHLRSLAPYLADRDARVRKAVVEAVTSLGNLDLDILNMSARCVQETEMEHLQKLVVEDAQQNVVQFAALQSSPTALYMLATGVDWTLDPRALRAKDARGRNVAHFAVERGHMDCLALMVDEQKLPRSALEEEDISGETPHDLATKHGHRKAMGLLDPVFVTLLSGRECRCSSLSDRSVSDLKEDAEQKLGVVIESLIGPDNRILDEEKTLEESGIRPSFILTALIAAPEGKKEDEEEVVKREIIEDSQKKALNPADHEGVLHDPKGFINFLITADVRLVRLEFLLELSEAGLAMPRRQEAETMRTNGGATALVELQEYRRLRVDEDSGHVSLDAGLGGQMVTVHFRSVSHMWESMEHPDPWRHQLSSIADMYRSLSGSGLVWVFIDFMSLYQYRRNGTQEISFQRALDMMHILYSHEIVQVDILDLLTPDSVQLEGFVTAYDEAKDCVELKPIFELKLNPTPHGQRGWCQAEKEWARLRNMLKGTGIPTPPEIFRQRIKDMRFTHRDDAEQVFQLQARVFNEKVAGTSHLQLENLTAEDLDSLCEALPSYSHLKYVVVNGNALTGREASALIQSGAMDIQMESCELTDEDAVMIAKGLIKAVHLKSLSLRGNRIGRRGLGALREVMQQRPELQITMQGQVPHESDAG